MCMRCVHVHEVCACVYVYVFTYMYVCMWCVYVCVHCVYVMYVCMWFKALTDRIRIQISYPNGQRIGFSFVTLTIQIDVPKSEQIRIIARPIRSDANTYI